MSISVTVQEKDRGYRASIDKYFTLAKSYSKVGFPEEARPGVMTRKGSSHEASPDMEEVAWLASVHEFGSTDGRIPRRPFFRPAILKNSEKLKQLQESIIRKVVSAQMPVRVGLMVMGEFLASKVKNEIRTGDFIPLKPETIRRKGSDKPLIDRGQMINSVTHIEISE